jgi:NitT/TauT family transport system substrate-binding protein
MNRTTRTFAAVAFATALAVVTGCSGADDTESAANDGKSREKVTYLTSFGNFGRDAYAWVAKEKGFFAEAGFDVEIKAGGGTGGNLQQVAAGQVDFTPVDLTGLLLARGTGNESAKEVTVVSAIQQRTMAAIVSLEGNGISTPKDLEGKKIADSPGSVVRNLFPTYAKLAGIDSDKVAWVNGEAATLMGNLASGSVEAIGQFVVGKPTVETVAKGKKAVLLPYSDVMTDLYGNVLITHAEQAKKDPEKVKRFVGALLKGLEYSIDNPKEAGEILARNVEGSNVQAAAAELELMAAFVRSAGSGTAVGSIDSQRVARSIAILQGAQAIPDGLTPEQLIDFDLAPKA